MTSVYIVLGVCVLLTGASLLLVSAEFRRTSRMLAALKQEWSTAETQFGSLAEEARQRLGTLKTVNPVTQPSPALSVDVRSRVQAMARRGVPVAEISRSSGLNEAEVEVLIGLSRLQTREAS